MASRASLGDLTSYGSGLWKFHLFCDIFSIPESHRLPASFDVLHSFVLWATADPLAIGSVNSFQVPMELMAVSVTRKYLTAVRAWHIVQGWPAPLSLADHETINWSLRGMDRLQQDHRKKPPRPPMTLAMLSVLDSKLDISSLFDACVWAMAACAFWGMMRFGEVSVNARSAFNGSRHLKRCDAFFGAEMLGKLCVKLVLPSAKTAAPGKTQSVFMTMRHDLCPIVALRNLADIVPANSQDPLFSWLDQYNVVRPMIKAKALARINSILVANGWGTSFRHLFRIGGASFFLAKKVNPEIVCIAGRWKSLAYQTYIRAFENIISAHMGKDVIL